MICALLTLGAFESATAEQLTKEKEFQDRYQWEVHNLPVTREKTKAALRKRSEEMTERLKDYKPNVRLEYYDGKGRVLSTKEAYKELSHKFHGRTSGKNKKEKIQRKEDEQRRMMTMASGDTPLNLASAMLERQKQLGTAGIVLTVGNRPYVVYLSPNQYACGANMQSSFSVASPSSLEPASKRQRLG
jgi:U4/U6.U5 tri-snRNP-associated protein 1